MYSNRELIAKQAREKARIIRRALMTPGFQYSLRATVSGNYPSVRGGTVHLNSGEVWKYGETTQGFSRYSKNYLNSVGLGLRMVPEYYGTQTGIKVMEKTKLYGYFFSHGRLPAGNRIFR